MRKNCTEFKIHHKKENTLNFKRKILSIGKQTCEKIFTGARQHSVLLSRLFHIYLIGGYRHIWSVVFLLVSQAPLFRSIQKYICVVYLCLFKEQDITLKLNDGITVFHSQDKEAQVIEHEHKNVRIRFFFIVLLCIEILFWVNKTKSVIQPLLSAQAKLFAPSSVLALFVSVFFVASEFDT